MHVREREDERQKQERYCFFLVVCTSTANEI